MISTCSWPSYSCFFSNLRKNCPENAAMELKQAFTLAQTEMNLSLHTFLEKMDLKQENQDINSLTKYPEEMITNINLENLV